jgi:TPR repeat protein
MRWVVPGAALLVAAAGGGAWLAADRGMRAVEQACLTAFAAGQGASAVPCEDAEVRGSASAGFLRAAAGLSGRGLAVATEARLAPALTVSALPVLRRADTRPDERRAALADLRDAAGAGYAPAQTWLAVTLLAGETGAARETEAADWLTRSARQGSADAQFLLAGLYRTGRGVVADRQRMRDLYLEAAQRGHAAAAFNLAADLFERGEAERARAWITRSAAGGFAPALAAMAAIAEAAGEPLAAATYHALAARFAEGERGRAAKAAAAAMADRLDSEGRALMTRRVAELEAAMRAPRR